MAAAAEDVFRVGRISTDPVSPSCLTNPLLSPPLGSERGLFFYFKINKQNPAPVDQHGHRPVLPTLPPRLSWDVFVGTYCQTAGFIPAYFSFRVTALRFVVGSADERRVNSHSGGQQKPSAGRCVFIQLLFLSQTYTRHSLNTQNSYCSPELKTERLPFTLKGLTNPLVRGHSVTFLQVIHSTVWPLRILDLPADQRPRHPPEHHWATAGFEQLILTVLGSLMLLEKIRNIFI